MPRPTKRDPGIVTGLRRAIRVFTVTVSDSRTPGTDESGVRLRMMLEAAGYSLAPHQIVTDDAPAIQELVRELIEYNLGDAMVTTGGTGIAPRDRTYEAIEPLLETKLDGFGEAFRRLSWDDVGARSVLSRAVAGVVSGRFIACLPGSPRAVALATDKILIPLLEHAVALCRGDTRHPSDPKGLKHQ
jgi:molybdenum cofactor biosynthesis protein B